MPLPQIPLASYRAFSASTVETLQSTIHSKLGAACVAAPMERPIAALANCYRLSAGELWFCSYGEAVKIGFAEGDYFRVQVHHAGAGSTEINHRIIPVQPGQGCVSSAAAVLSFGAGFQQLAWRVNRQALARKLAAMVGAPVSRTLEFEPALDLTLPRARAFLGILHSAVHAITADESNRYLLVELEQALMVSLLSLGEHNCRSLLQGPPKLAGPWQLRLVEDHIDAHLDRPFNIEDAVNLTGCSARSIYRAFQKYRGYSPLEFSKHRRLLTAHRLLAAIESNKSIAQIAEACGFSDLSHFSRDYRRMFSESPSTTRCTGRTSAKVRFR